MGDCGGCKGCGGGCVVTSIDTVADRETMFEYLHPVKGKGVDDSVYRECFRLANGWGRGVGLDDMMGSTDEDRWPHFEKSTFDAIHKIAVLLRKSYDEEYRKLRDDIIPLICQAEAAVRGILNRLEEEEVWNDRHRIIDIAAHAAIDKLFNIWDGVE